MITSSTSSHRQASSIEKKDGVEKLAEAYIGMVECARRPDPLSCFAHFVENKIRSAGITEITFRVRPHADNETKTITLKFHDKVELIVDDGYEQKNSLAELEFDLESLMDLLLPYFAETTGRDVNDLVKMLAIHNIENITYKR